MDVVATYLVVFILAFYQMLTNTDDRVFLFWALLLCFLMPLWVRVCMKYGRSTDE